MTISQLIRILESIRDQYGNLLVTHYHGGGEQTPTVEIVERDIVFDENGEAVELPTVRRVVLK